MSVILGFFQNLKLSLTQYLLLTMATIIGILAVLLKFKEKELQETQLKLLGAHFDASQALTENRIQAANNNFDVSLRRLNEAVSKYHNDPSSAPLDDSKGK